MLCLPKEQLVNLALELEVDADWKTHLNKCRECRENLARYRSVMVQLKMAHGKLERGHAEARARLFLELPVRHKQSTLARIRNDIVSWIKGLDMTRRIALSSAGASAVLMLLIMLSATVADRASAMERMKSVVSKARSFKAKMTQEDLVPAQPGQPAAKHTVSGVSYWQTPRSTRTELKGLGGMDTVVIYPAGKPGIQIDHKSKTYRCMPERRGHLSPFMMLEGLSSYSGDADRLLGTKEINGRRASGFMIDTKKIDPDAHSGTAEIWIDDETYLPVEMHIAMENTMAQMVLRMENIQWNEQLDPSLFALAPPDGYADSTPKAPVLEEQIKRISTALKMYSQLSGGHYPRVNIIYGDVTRDEMLEMAGYKRFPTQDQMKDKKYQAIIGEVSWGLATINSILRDNSDAAYFGRTVGPNDKDKVLLRWRLEDGSFHVLYGDLRDETLTRQSASN